jgi:acetyl esterase
MPLSPLFKDRLHFLLDESKPIRERALAFETPLSEYVSPPIETKDVSIDGPLGPIKARLYRPAGNTEVLPGLVWFHGGGFTFGDIDMNESNIVSRELAHRSTMAVLTVDYALCSPEQFFPAPQNDGIASLRWFAANAKELKIDLDHIFVGGISAGGALAAAVAVHDRDSGDNILAGQLLNCPDLHRLLPPFGEEAKARLAEEPNAFFFLHEGIAAHNASLFEPGAPAEDWWFAGDAKSKAGLAPTQIINCEYDGLRASGEEYGRHLAAEGSEVEVLTQAGVPHAHINRYPADCAEMVETLDNMVRWMKAH